jgi:transcriptional regulator with XRE-family HTH domain
MCSVDGVARSDSNKHMGKGARSRLARMLRVLRVARGWSQEDLAGASGLHRTYISLIERSACSASLDNLERLANTFEITLPELLNTRGSVDLRDRPSVGTGKAGRKTGGR